MIPISARRQISQFGDSSDYGPECKPFSYVSESFVPLARTDVLFCQREVGVATSTVSIDSRVDPRGIFASGYSRVAFAGLGFYHGGTVSLHTTFLISESMPFYLSGSLTQRIRSHSSFLPSFERASIQIFEPNSTERAIINISPTDFDLDAPSFFQHRGTFAPGEYSLRLYAPGLFDGYRGASDGASLYETDFDFQLLVPESGLGSIGMIAIMVFVAQMRSRRHSIRQPNGAAG